MRFGLSFLPDAPPSTRSAREYFAACLDLCEMADAEGFASIKMTEHYLRPYGGFCPSPLAFLASVAPRTRQIRLMTGGVLPTFHHPIQLASEAAMVDAISGGRLEIGFARAYMPYEFAAFGIPLDESRARFVATIDTVLRLWTETDVSIETPFFAVRGATTLPRPTQSPHPPVWVAASLSPESFEWIGRRGFNLMATNLLSDAGYLKELIAIYRRAFAEAHGPREPQGQVALSIPVYVARAGQAACQEGDCYLSRHLTVWAAAADTWSTHESSAYPGYAHMADVIRHSAPEVLRRHDRVVFGSPPQVVDAICRLKTQFGVDQILCQMDFGAMPRDASTRSFRVFARDVLPRFESALRADAASAP
jgi:alkanesulfonate monooxygenase SsuD/methylene tetrahydromethanopterin reductase-like flavin-dependent oxidoreductase (luciferase family)